MNLEQQRSNKNEDTSVCASFDAENKTEDTSAILERQIKAASVNKIDITKKQVSDANFNPTEQFTDASDNKVNHNRYTSLTTLEIYMYIIDKDDNKLWRTIYEEIHEGYFEDEEIFIDDFLDWFKRNPNLT